MLCLGTAPDQCFFFLVRPTGPETIDVEIGYIFHPSALEDPLFEAKLALSDAGVQVFVEQDQDATTKVQRGLRSRFAPRGARYSWQEESHVQFNRPAPLSRRLAGRRVWDSQGSWGSEKREDSTVRMLIRPDQKVIRFRSGNHHARYERATRRQGSEPI